MAVDVRLPTMLRQHAGGQSTVRANGSTVAEALHDLALQFPQLRSQLLSEDGTLHRFVNVYVDDDDVRYLDSLETKLTGNEVISILPAVAGGSGG